MESRPGAVKGKMPVVGKGCVTFEQAADYLGAMT
jgi:hypothetical protein